MKMSMLQWLKRYIIGEKKEFRDNTVHGFNNSRQRYVRHRKRLRTEKMNAMALG